METTMRARWTIPAVGVALGLLMLAAASIGGDPRAGAGMLVVMLVYSATLLVFGGRSDTIGVLAGRPADERYGMIGVHATAVAGVVGLIVALAGFLWATAHGQSGLDFALVAASAGIAYLGALIWFRWRG
jgi:hypothetical protein